MGKTSAILVFVMADGEINAPPSPEPSSKLESLAELALAGVVSAGVFTMLEEFPMWARATVTLSCLVALLCLHFSRDNPRYKTRARIAAGAFSTLGILVFVYAVFLGKPSTERPTISAKPAESAYSDMSNARLREITLTHVKSIRALRERTDESINTSNLTNLGSLNHQQWIADQFNIEMWRYRSKYLAKSVTLMSELRKREPDYLLEMDAQRLDSLDRAYREPFIPQDLDTVADDLDTMAQHLPADVSR
jgi:hypothetical protein